MHILLYKSMNLSHFILERVDVSVLCERWVERYILRERTSSFPYLMPMLAPPCKLIRDASGWLRVTHSTDSLPKSDRVLLITWSPSSYTPVRPECPDVLLSSCLLIKMWQLTKAHGVTRNEPKIHVICYIT